MYLAKLYNNTDPYYLLRISKQTEPHLFTHQTVFDLGCQPQDHFEIFAEQTVIFSPRLLGAVASHNIQKSEILLEELFFDFFPPHIQKKFNDFKTHKEYKSGPLSADEKNAIKKQVHIFDRRRLYYLKYGAVDQSRLSNLHEKCCRPLLGMSRDEKEFFFQAEERSLEAGIYLQYIYAIFNLQRFFTQSFAAWMPEALQKDQIGDFLQEEICKLNSDVNFWQQKKAKTTLHFHLQRYLIMFFDHAATPPSFFDDFSRNFQNQFRNFTWPEQSNRRSPEQIAKIFDTTYDTLQKMSVEELNRLYRKKAMKLHPDQGGDSGEFINLTEAYQQLKQKKSSP